MLYSFLFLGLSNGIVMDKINITQRTEARVQNSTSVIAKIMFHCGVIDALSGAIAVWNAVVFIMVVSRSS